MLDYLCIFILSVTEYDVARRDIFVLEEILGEGQFGDVFKGIFIYPVRYRILKCI